MGHNVLFERVLIEELAHIRRRRAVVYERARRTDVNGRLTLAKKSAPDLKDSLQEFENQCYGKNEDERLARARVAALEENLASLAFSGGGIRSATFALGVLQGLASLKLLRFFDILSTVSGGGYTGGWLATWMQREGDPLNVERQLDVNRIGQSKANRDAVITFNQVIESIEERLKKIAEELEKKTVQSLERLLCVEQRPCSDEVKQKLKAIFDKAMQKLKKISKEKQELKKIQDEVMQDLKKTLQAIQARTMGDLTNMDCDQASTLLAEVEKALSPARESIDAAISRFVDGWREKIGEPTTEEKRKLASWLEDSGKKESKAAVANLIGDEAIKMMLEQTCNQIKNWQVKEVVDAEPEPILHLRRYSSYLNPRPGLLSPDTWTLIAIYTRNILINFLFLMPIVVLAVLLIRLVIYDYNQRPESWLRNDAQLLERIGAGWLVNWVKPGLKPRLPFLLLYVGGIAGILGVLALGLNTWAVLRIRNQRRGVSFLETRRTLGLVVGMLFSSALFLMMTYQPILDALREILATLVGHSKMGSTEYLGRTNVVGHVLAFGTVASVLFLSTYLCSFISDCISKNSGRGSMFPPFWQTLAAFMAGGTVGALLPVIAWLLRQDTDQPVPWLRAMVGPPLILLAIVVGIAAHVALAGTAAKESEREWWGRLAALLMQVGLCWFLGVGVVVFGPVVLLGSHQLLAAALASGWILSTVAGVLAGKSGAVTGRPGSSRRLEFVAQVSPPIFLIGLLAVSSTLVTFLLSEQDDVDAIHVQPTFGRALNLYLRTFTRTNGTALRLCWVLTPILAALAYWLVNVNLFSLHALYANRLTRAFLGASRPNRSWEKRWRRENRDQRALVGVPTGAIGPTRDANPVTGFDPEDDLELACLKIGAGDNAKYWGPHVIFNTAMNLVGGDELAWRDRKAESFTLTPLYCGARTTGYVKTPEETDGRLTVGRAIAVSGAAVDPNMNYHQSPAVTALLTVFNARLGIWIQNPNLETWGPRKQEKKWEALYPKYGPLLFNEVTGNTNERGKYVHLSDGGHFDNLGVYELVRRRCRYIVAVDATENPLATSDNLGILVRLCRVDLGVRIQLETAPLKVTGSEGESRAHVVMGLIRYDDMDQGQTPGMLVYIKSTLTGDEPPDVQQYRNLHPEFPRQLTLTDQSFDEDQFESYRALGDHIARNVFEVAAHSVFQKSKGDGEAWWKIAQNGRDAFLQGHRKIFSAIRSRWTEPPVRQNDRYLESVRAWAALQRDLREREILAPLARDFYPELAILDDPEEGPRRRAELHTMEQTVQLMEEAWLALGLERRDDAPISRGWLNVFGRLAGSEAFRLFWPLLRAECGPEFVRFCERSLHANRREPQLRPIKVDDPAIANLGAEFAREWPGSLSRNDGVETLDMAGRRFLWDRTNRAIKLLRTERDREEMPATWLIVDGPLECDPDKEGKFEFPLGIMAVFPANCFGKKLGLKPSNSTVLDANCCELFLWVRRAHRSSGVGEAILRSETIDRLVKHLEKNKSCLLVCYPSTDLESEEDVERVRWLAFFSLFGFAPDPNTPREAGQDWTLYKMYG